MPKILDNPQERLLLEAKRQIEESGYAAMTVRSVANACGVGVGTVYNYFPSKEAMVATYLAADWKTCLAAIYKAGELAETPEPLLRCIYEELNRFILLHSAVFRDETAASGFSGSFGRYHTLLRSQLAQPLRKFCESDFSADFIAEALLTWTSSGTEFDELNAMIKKLFT